MAYGTHLTAKDVIRFSKQADEPESYTEWS